MEKRLVISFSDGEEVISGIGTALQEHDVDFALFSEGSGCLRNFELLPSSRKSPHYDYVLDSVSGSAVRKAKDFEVNLKLSLLRKGNIKTAPLVGRLKKGIVSDSLSLILTLKNVKGIIK